MSKMQEVVVKDIRNTEIREEKEKFVKDAFKEDDTTFMTRVKKNQIITDLLIYENENAKKKAIEDLSRNKKDIREIHIVSDEIAFIEEYDKYDDINYFRPVINGKLVNHLFDTFDKALIGAMSYKYGVQDFAYQAITAMFGIKDEE